MVVSTEMDARLPSADSIVRRDFRPPSTVPQSVGGQPIRLLQWNIERGYKLDGVIEELKSINADVICLQEVDVHCERSGNRDTGTEIAEALRLNYIFFTEFEELRSPLRTPELQGGGVHGNAILSKFDLEDVELIHHGLVPVDWNDPANPHAQTEPRRGRRAVLRATVRPPGHEGFLVYCAHLEVFCGVLARMAHLVDIFEDARAQIDKGIGKIAILGDMNTMAHGVARLSRLYCCDTLRFRNLGFTEAEVWEREILAFPDPAYDPAAPDAGKERVANPQLVRWGLPLQTAQAALNPGFRDPFPAISTVTLDNPRYRLWRWSLMAGKLDWVLLRGLHVTRTLEGNAGYALADHKWLAVEVDG